MQCLLHSIFGQRLAKGQLRCHPVRFALPTVIMLAAATVLLLSFTQRYWGMTLYAPQYPKGLHVQAYLDRLEGDVAEIDGLNHYIGMRPLEEAARYERQYSPYILIAFACMLGATAIVRTRWAVLLVLPPVTFPLAFLLDLHFWLNHFGQNLDPKAALSSSIKPFTPPVLGEGLIGQFRTVAWADTGLYMACVASALAVAGLYFHRRAYKNIRSFALQRAADAVVRVDAKSHASCSLQRPAACSLPHRSMMLAACVAVNGIASAPTAAVQVEPFDLHHEIAAAPHGAIIEVPPSPRGVYRGPVVIDRSVTLKAVGHVVIDGEGSGDVVRISAPDVTFQGFVVRGSGSNIDGENAGITTTAPRTVIIGNTVEDALFGISFKTAPDGVIRNNTVVGKKLDIARRGDAIRIWQSNNVLVEDNIVRDSRDVVMWFSNNVTLRRNTVTNSRYGMHFMYTHDNVLEDNRLEGNSVGAFLMYSRNLVVRRNVFARNRGPSGYGLGLKDMQGVLAEDNIFAGNRVGVYLDNPPMFGGEFDTFTRNLFAHNDLGLAFQPMVKQMLFTENSFVENMQQVAVMSSGTFSGNKFAVDGVGNFWSDYRGFDLDRDGVGDTPYHADSMFENLMEREPALRLFIYSPAQQAIELAGRAFPIMQPNPKVSDESPLMQSVPVQIEAATQKSSLAMWLSAGGLLGIAALMLTAARPQFASRKNGAA